MVNRSGDAGSGAKVSAKCPVAITPYSVLRTQHPVARRGLTLLELTIVLAVLSIMASLLLPAVGNFLSQSRSNVTQQSLTQLRDVIAETYWPDNGSLPQPGVFGLLPANGRQNNPQLRYLFVNPTPDSNIQPQTEDDWVSFNPATRVGWRGPYVIQRNNASYTSNTPPGFLEQTSAATGVLVQYAEIGDPAVLDGWGNPIVIQNPGPTPDGVGQDVRVVSAGPNGILTMDPGVSSAYYLANPSQAGGNIFVSFEVR